MAWKGLKLTADGQKALSAAQAAQKLKIRSVAVGDGSFTGEPHELKELVSQLYEIEDLEIVLKDAICMVTAELPEKEYEYFFREIGVMVETEEGVKLYAYDNCGDEAQQVIPGTDSATVKRRVRLTLTVANVAEVTVTNPAVMYVTYDDFQEAMEKKVDVEEGKGLSANDYTDEDKRAVGGIQEALKKKVDAEEGKGLSSNDFTDQDKEAVGGLGGLGFGQDEKGNWGYKVPGAEVVVPFGAGGDIEEAARFERIVIGSCNDSTFKGGKVLATFPNDFEYKYGQVFVEIVYSMHGAYNVGSVGQYTTGMVAVPPNSNEFVISLDGLYLEPTRKLLLKRTATIKNASPNVKLKSGDEIVLSQSFRYDLATGSFANAIEENDPYLVPKFCFLYIKNKTIYPNGTELQ